VKMDDERVEKGDRRGEKEYYVVRDWVIKMWTSTEKADESLEERGSQSWQRKIEK
jgi:hypothetical protein